MQNMHYHFMVLLPCDVPLISQSLITFSLSLLLEAEFVRANDIANYQIGIIWNDLIHSLINTI